MTRPDPHAYPPRGMDRDASARWIGVGTTKFDEMVADGRMPKPGRADGRVVWDRYKLDAAFTDLFDQPAQNAIDAALSRGLDRRAERAA
jgi:hypothetical protein